MNTWSEGSRMYRLINKLICKRIGGWIGKDSLNNLMNKWTWGDSCSEWNEPEWSRYWVKHHITLSLLSCSSCWLWFADYEPLPQSICAEKICWLLVCQKINQKFCCKILQQNNYVTFTDSNFPLVKNLLHCSTLYFSCRISTKMWKG